MDKAEKNEFIEKAPEDDRTQIFAYRIEGDKWTLESRNNSLSRSTNSTSNRLQWKVKSQDKEMLLPRIVEIRRFLVVVTLKSLGNCK